MRLVGILIAALAGTSSGLLAADSMNDFEWTAVAPIVVVAQNLGENGRYHEIRVERVFRGDVAEQDVLRLDLKQANRSRDLDLKEKPLRLDAATLYLMLLEPGHSAKARKHGAYWLARGIHGLREVPAEGADALIEVVQRFVDIQNLDSEAMKWDRLSDLLEDPNTILVGTALEQFNKFRRGAAPMFPLLLPLLDHPEAGIRGSTARLMGQILDRLGPGAGSVDQTIRIELAARARRDPEVEVRVAATEALRHFDDEAMVAVLLEIADADPEQIVRLAAEKIILERREASN